MDLKTKVSRARSLDQLEYLPKAPPLRAIGVISYGQQYNIGVKSAVKL